MSKNRYINTRFWDDQYITTLDPIEKLLFLYFLTNPLTDVSGVYEITTKRIAFDTGLDIEVVNSVLKRFEAANKIFYLSGWLYIKNFAKHQAVNDNMQKGIDRSLKELPDEIKAKISQIESLSNPSEALGLLKPILIPKLKLELKPKYSSANKSRKDKFETDKYPKADYVKVLDTYQKLKGIKLQGDEFLPPMAEIKRMFKSGRTVVQIIETMEICEQNYEDWAMSTARMKIADVVGGKLLAKLKPGQKEVLAIKSTRNI